MNSDNKKVALVTGSTHGIGKVIILELAKIGFSVVINGASTIELSEDYINNLGTIYNEEIENNYTYIQADVSKKEDREKLKNETEDFRVLGMYRI